MSDELVSGLILTVMGALGGLILSFLIGGIFRSGNSPTFMMIMIIAGSIFGLIARLFLIDAYWLQRFI